MAISNSIIGGLNTLDGGGSTNSSQVVESFVEFGTVKSNSYFSISMSGDYDDKLTVDNSEIDHSEIYPSDGVFNFNCSNMSVNISLSAKCEITLSRLRVYVNDELVRTIKFYGGTIFNKTFYGVSIAKGTSNTDIYPSSIDVSLGSTKKYYGGNPWGESKVEVYNYPTFTTSGKKHVYVEVDYYPSLAYLTNESLSLTTVKFDLGYIFYYPLVFKNIYISSYPTKQKFYKGETFSTDGLLVYGQYNFHSYVGGNLAYITNVTSLISKTTPDMTSVGEQWVTLKYNGSATGYTITVVDVASVSENTPTNFKIDHETNPGTPSKIVITYSDGTTREVSATDCNFQWLSGDFNSTGDKTWAYSVYDENTKSTIEGTSIKKVYDVSSLTLTGTYKTSYQTNESFDTSGMVFTATYGEAGSETIDASKITFSGFISSAVASSLPITCSYRTGTCKFDIKVDGLTDIRIVLPNSSNIIKHLQNDTTTSLTEGITLYYTTSDNGEQSLSLNSANVSIDTSEVNINQNGTYNVYITVTYLGNSITKSYQVEIYSLESLVLSNYKEEFIYSSNAPAFSVGSLSVLGHFSDGTERVLTTSEYNVSQPDNMEVGTHTVIVSSTIGTTVSATYQIEVINNCPIEITSVDISKWTNVFTKGQTFSKQGIVVKATMLDGATNRIVDFYTTLDNKVFGTDITNAETSFEIKVESEDDDGNVNILTYGSSFTAIYDKLESISVDTTNAKTTYKAGELISKDGLVVTAKYHTSGNKVLQASDYTLSRTTTFSKDDKGSNTITITYQDQTTTFNVSVIVLDSLSISVSKNQYDRYDDIDLSTITLTKKYSDNSTETLSVGNSVITGRKEKVIPDNSDGKTTTLTFSYTEALITKSVSYNFSVKCLSSVALSIDKISVNYGESLSLVGKNVNITFNTGESYLLAINSGNTIVLNGTTYQLSFNLDSTIIKNKVNATIGMTYGQETKYDDFVIHCISLGSITMTSTYSSETLYAGDKIELNNFAISKTIVSTDDTDTSYPQTSDLEVSDVTFNVDDNYRLLAGDNKIIATYSMGLGDTLQTKSASLTLNALEIILQSINVDTTNLSKALDSYVDGQSLNLVGLVINAVFNKTSSNKELDLSECKVYIDEEERYYTTSLSTSDNGKTLVISYTYNGTTKTAEVGSLKVVAKELVSISARSSSTNKIAYLIGDTFSSSGLILDAKYNDGFEDIVSSGFATSLDSKTEIFKSSDVGTIAVIVYLTVGTITKSTTYNITVSNPELKSIRYDASLIKLSVTNGNVFSLTGLKVYGTYENDYEEEVEWTTPNIATELSYDSEGKVDFSSTDLGTKNVTLQVQNPYISTQLPVTTNLPVTVTPNLALVDIKLEYDEEQDAYNYRVGDTFTAKGLIVKALFKDTDWITVSDFETSNPTLGSLLRSGGKLEVVVSYTSNGVVKSQSYTITVAMPYDSGLVEEKTYKIVFNVSSITHEEATISFSEDTQLPLFFGNYVSVDSDEESSTYGLNIYTGSNADSDCIGYIKLGSTSEIDGSIIENGQVVLFDDPVNPIDGQGNIVVKFPHYVQDYADRINKCKFGIIYNKRLFVSGNTDYPNTDWHSSQVNSSQVENYDTEEDRDLTYFSDLDYCRYGSENSAVKGYDIYRDGTLLVFKGKANHEATIYTRQQQLVNASSYDGTIVSEGELAEEAYPCFEVNPNGGAGAISNYSIINFVGETLVLTSEGLKAITSKESTYNNAKYTYDVSSHINNRLIRNNNLNYAIISQYQEKLLLKTDEGLYVGEYKLRDDNSEYEWYFCSNINAHYFFELDDELYFSDTNGNICRFVNDTSVNRQDKPRTYIGLAGTTLDIDANNDTIIVSKDYADDVVNGNEFHLLNKISKITGDTTDESQVYATMGLFIDSNVRDNYLEQGISTFDQTAYAGLIDADNNELIIMPYTSSGDIDYERMNDINLLFYDYKVIYLDKIDGNTSYLEVDKAYRLKRVESESSFDYRYSIIDSEENVIDLHGITSFRVNFRVNGLAMAYIIDVEDYGTDGGKQFKVGLPLKADEDDTSYVALDLVYYNDRNGTYQGVITKRVNVNSYFVTKPFNLGHDLYQKSIYMWSIINDSQIASRMDVGYIASRSYADFEIVVKEIGGARQLSFEQGYNFEKLHFTNDLLPHIYNKYKVLPRVGFIRFIFKNDEGTRMVISKLDIIYTYSLLMKGVK